MNKKEISIAERLAVIETMMTNHLEHHRIHEKWLMWWVGLAVPVVVMVGSALLRRWVG